MALYQHGLVAALGIFMVVIGVVIPRLIDWQVTDSIRSALSVDGVDDSGYQKWLEQSTSLQQYKIRGFELTNPAQFVAGAKPNFKEWSSDEEVWVRLRRPIKEVNFTSDRTKVRTRAFQTYTEEPNSPGSIDKYLFTFNFAYISMVNQAGSEQNLFVAFTSTLFAKVLATSGGVAAFIGVPQFCMLGTACGYAKAQVINPSLPTLTATQAQQMLTSFANVTNFGAYLTLLGAMQTYAGAGNAAGATAVAGQLTAMFPFFSFSSNTADGVVFMWYALYLIQNTGTSVTAAYDTSGMGTLLFKNATLRDHLFKVDPLLTLAGLSVTVFSNNTDKFSTIKTGYQDDYYLGMDYYLETSGQTTVVGYPGGPFSVEARQTSTTPFQPRKDSFSVFFPTAMRHVKTMYTGDDTYKRVPVWRYEIDMDNLAAIDPYFGTKVTGLLDISYVNSGAQFVLTAPHFWKLDPTWASKVTGVDAFRASDVSFLMVEKVSGLAIQGTAQMQVNIFLNITSASQYTALAAQANNAFVLPMVIAVQYAEASDDSCNSLHDAVVYAPFVERVIFFVLVIIGAVLIGVAVLSYVYVLWRARNSADANGQTEGDATGGKTVDDGTAMQPTSTEKNAVNPFDGHVGPKSAATEEMA